MFENHMIRNNSYHIESGCGLGQVQTCLATFLSDKNLYDYIILCHLII